MSSSPPASDRGDEVAASPSPEGTLLERLRFRAGQAAMNDRGITAALHREAADEIEALYATISEDRQLRWALRTRLDVALARLAQLGVTDV